jgi:hypothetical protein
MDGAQGLKQSWFRFDQTESFAHDYVQGEPIEDIMARITDDEGRHFHPAASISYSIDVQGALSAPFLKNS